MRSRWILGLLAAVAAVVVCGVLVVAVFRSDETLVFDLDVGQCFDLPESVSEGVLDTVTPISCDEPHQVEVVAVGALNPDRELPFPGDDAVLAQVDQLCRHAINSGSPYASAYEVVPVAPNEKTWGGLDGRYSCVAAPYGGGSTRGSLVPPEASSS
jgi:hypothetical protein